MRNWLFIMLLIFSGNTAFSQNVGIGTSNPNNSAALDISSNKSGLLIPRMSGAQRMAINNPAKGLLVFDNDSSVFFFYNGTAWVSILASNNGFKLTTTTITMSNNNSGSYTVNDLEIGSATYIRLSGQATNQQFTITGITGGSDGKMIVLRNTGNGNMILKNLDSGSNPANQIDTQQGGQTNTNGKGSITLLYDGTEQKWLVTSIQN